MGCAQRAGRSPMKNNIGRGLRSLPQLRVHLTARSDDNHAAPVSNPRRGPDITRDCIEMSSSGKVPRLLSN